jgi:hypothetical protein
MAEVGMKEIWSLNVDTAELRLILKALGGRLKPEDLDEAKSLGNDLSRMRANVTKNKIQASDRLLHDVGEV